MSYTNLIEVDGIEVVDSVYEGDYQGDLYMIVKRGDQYGYTVVGYGSCSGCDAYEAAHDDTADSHERWDLSDLELIAKYPDSPLARLQRSLVEGIDWADDKPGVVVMLAEALADESRGYRYYYSDPSFRTWALERIREYTTREDDA